MAPETLASQDPPERQVCRMRLVFPFAGSPCRHANQRAFCFNFQLKYGHATSSQSSVLFDPHNHRVPMQDSCIWPNMVEWIWVITKFAEPGPTGGTGETGNTGSTGGTGFTGETGVQNASGLPFCSVSLQTCKPA